MTIASMQPLSEPTIEQRRLAWRCRRGMLELDIVLQTFISEYFEALTGDELTVFDEMLDLPDNVFWGLVADPSKIHENAIVESVLTKIRAK
jgi:antitoxin CptB